MPVFVVYIAVYIQLYICRLLYPILFLHRWFFMSISDKTEELKQSDSNNTVSFKQVFKNEDIRIQVSEASDIYSKLEKAKKSIKDSDLKVSDLWELMNDDDDGVDVDNLETDLIDSLDLIIDNI